MNAPNMSEIVNKLTKKNVAVDYQEHSWGTVANFFDPDGNLYAIKRSGKFEKQIAYFTTDS